MTIRHWLLGLLAAVISAASDAILVTMVAPETFNFGLGFKKLLTVIAFSAIKGAALYLKQSPVPVDLNTVAPPAAKSAGQGGFIRLGAQLLLSSLLLAVLVMVACPQSDIHKAATTADGIAVTLNNIEKLQQDAWRAHLISDADSRAVSTADLAAVQINAQFVVQVRSIKTINSTSAGSILAAIDTLAQSIDKLEAEGAFHIKDAKTQSTFASYIAVIRQSIAVARALVSAHARLQIHVRPGQLEAWRSPGLESLFADA